MGTRALVKVIDDERPICCIYKQFDGYPSGLGAAIKEFADGMQIVNGLNANSQKVANGMGCFAAQLVKHLKDVPGNVYLEHPDTVNCGEEYTYAISEGKNGTLDIEVHEGSVTMFGFPSPEGERPHQQPAIYKGPLANYLKEECVAESH